MTEAILSDPGAFGAMVGILLPFGIPVGPWAGIPVGPWAG
ncbi:MAG: hypothetical protein RIT02_2627, partial [Planctomycetota bacterium]